VSDTLLSFEDVSIHYQNRSSILQSVPAFLRDQLDVADPEVVRAVDDISLAIPENDVLAVVGESGCGKTTLGKAAVGLQQPTEGSINYRGQDIWEAAAGNGELPWSEIRQALQIIHQDPEAALNPNKRVLHTLRQPLRRWKPDLTRGQQRERVLALLDRVGVTPPEDYIERFPHQLSGGEKQRVVLCRALLMEPDLILADEAVSALDVSLRVEVMDLMLELQEVFDTSFVFISHNLSNARYFAGREGGRIAVMYLGRIVEMGPAKEIVRNPQHPYTKALKWATPDLDPDLAEASMREAPPMRGIDIPDPIDPPSGCRFHTRCPEAREACRETEPELVSHDGAPQRTACFLHEDPSHDYWESSPLAPEAIGTFDRPETGAGRSDD